MRCLHLPSLEGRYDARAKNAVEDIKY